MNRSIARVLLGALTLAVPVLSGCQAPKREPEPVDPRSVAFFAGDASGVVPWEGVVAASAGSAVVVIGEIHGHPLGLDLAAELFEDILRANPRAVLSMEFYERDQQTALDDYVAGIITAEQFDQMPAWRGVRSSRPTHRGVTPAWRGPRDTSVCLPSRRSSAGIMRFPTRCRTMRMRAASVPRCPGWGGTGRPTRARIRSTGSSAPRPCGT
jgi:hypothetical protein